MPTRTYGTIICPGCNQPVLKTSPNFKRCKPCALEAHGQTGTGFKDRQCGECEAAYKPTGRSQKVCETCIPVVRARNNLEHLIELRRKAGQRVVGATYQCADCRDDYVYHSGPEKRCQTCQNKFGNFQANEASMRSPKRPYWAKLMKANAAFGKGLKPAVLARDGHVCRKCGADKNLHVHHIDGRGKGYPRELRNNTIENLITLCGVCHALVHAETERRLWAAHPETVRAVFDEILHHSSCAFNTEPETVKVKVPAVGVKISDTRVGKAPVPTRLPVNTPDSVMVPVP